MMGQNDVEKLIGEARDTANVLRAYRCEVTAAHLAYAADAAEAHLKEQKESEREVRLEKRAGDGACAIMHNDEGTGISLDLVDARYIFGVEPEGMDGPYGTYTIRREPEKPKVRPIRVRGNFCWGDAPEQHAANACPLCGWVSATNHDDCQGCNAIWDGEPRDLEATDG